MNDSHTRFISFQDIKRSLNSNIGPGTPYLMFYKKVSPCQLLALRVRTYEEDKINA